MGPSQGQGMMRNHAVSEPPSPGKKLAGVATTAENLQAEPLLNQLRDKQGSQSPDHPLSFSGGNANI